MAENDMLKRYLEAGMAFTQMTRSRAEAIVKDLVRAGELQREQTQERVEELVERSRKNTDALVAMVRKEIRAQLDELGIRGRRRSASKATATKAASKTTTAAKAAGKKAAGGAKKASSGAKKATKSAKKTTKSTAKKAAKKA